ncbi:MAG: glycine cleavage system protein H [Promethearchaeota archaeon]
MSKISDYNFPEDLYYSQRHIWAKMEKDGMITLGLTDYARKNIEDIVVIELFLKEDSQIQSNQPFGAIDSSKGTNILYSPVSGKISKRNRKIMMDPLVVVRKPYTLGWLIKIEPSSSLEEELESLMKQGTPEFEKWLKTEIEKFK